MKKKNFFGAKLNSCSTNPMTGFKRNGCCESVEGDYGKHIICAEVSREFLNFSLSKGNDLITPNNEFKFPGHKAGDRWCLCAGRWYEAYKESCAPKIILASTSLEVIKYIDVEILKKFAIDLN